MVNTVFYYSSTECIVKNLDHTLTVKIFHLVRPIMNDSGAKLNTFNIKISLKELFKEYFARNVKNAMVKTRLDWTSVKRDRMNSCLSVCTYVPTSVTSFSSKLFLCIKFAKIWPIGQNTPVQSHYMIL